MHELTVGPKSMALTLRKMSQDSVAVIVHEVRRLQDKMLAHEAIRDAWLDMEAEDIPGALIEMPAANLQHKWRGYLAAARSTWLSRYRRDAPVAGPTFAGGHVAGCTGDKPPLRVLKCAECGVTITCNVSNPAKPVGIGRVPVVMRGASVLCWPCSVDMP